MSLPTLELSSEIYETLTGMATDVHPRENCIAPAIVLIVWTTFWIGVVTVWVCRNETSLKDIRISQGL